MAVVTERLAHLAAERPLSLCLLHAPTPGADPQRDLETHLSAAAVVAVLVTPTSAPRRVSASPP